MSFVPLSPRLRPRRGIGLAAMLLSLCSLSAGTAMAHELEFGGYLGAHLFASGNELGRPDRDPRSPDNAPQHMAMLGGWLGYAPHPHFQIEAELGFVPSFTRDTSTALPMLAYRAHLVAHLLTGRYRPYALVGGGLMSVFSSDTSYVNHDTDPEMHAGVGLKVDVTPRLLVRAEARLVLLPRIEDTSFAHEGEFFIGVGTRLGPWPKAAPPAPKDGDGDGLTDDKDQCPAEAEDLDGFQDSDGCPDPDNDSDGIKDAQDRCPSEAGVAENQGCPDTDKDGDTIVDRLDLCPDQPGVASEKGCPEPDQDKDGVLDKDDKCPQSAGPKDLGGCPDTDGDGLLDKDDKCPDKAETKNGYQDADGCPDEIPQAVAKFTGVIAGINFKNGKDAITKPSFKILDQAAKVLTENADVRLEISGHTDSAGNADKNKDLSRRRAEAVRKYLIDKGVAEARLTAAGYGPDRPIADNKTKKGKAQNRRVEFKLLQ